MIDIKVNTNMKIKMDMRVNIQTKIMMKARRSFGTETDYPEMQCYTHKHRILNIAADKSVS